MGFVRIFWKNNVQEAPCQDPSAKNKHFGATVSEILAQLCSDNSIQILLNLTWVEHYTILHYTIPNSACKNKKHIATGGFCKREKLRCADRESGLPHIGRFSATFCGRAIRYWNRSNDSEREWNRKKALVNI